MKHSMPLVAALVGAAALNGGCIARTLTVRPEDIVIVARTNAARTELAMAADLQKHLELVAGTDLGMVTNGAVPAGKYPFYVNVAPAADNTTLPPGEARWTVTPEATYLYGGPGAGARHAVYEFLENELGCLWVQPGEIGTVYRKQSPLTLTPGDFRWQPELWFRAIRTGVRRIKEAPPPLPETHPLKDFTVPWETHNRFVGDALQWNGRMRMGTHISAHYGHAFTDWWPKYGKTHPEYFAMRENGERGPADHRVTRIKLCPSNPEVADQIIRDWLALPYRPHGVNVCENDSPPRDFCTCSNCVALDAPVEGREDPGRQEFTDRWVYLVNTVARKAREHDPEAFATMYAYNETERPPRRYKLEPNVVVGIVPTTADARKVKQLFRGWRAAGATKVFIRPNLHHYYFATTIPMGFEKQFYDVFQAAYGQGGLIGTDYDSHRHMWPRIADYVQARAFSDPSKPFEHWEDQYCSAYGPAADVARRYFRYWREEVWEKRLLPNMDTILACGCHFNFARGVMWSMDKYYTAEDFDRTDAILEEAATKTLNDRERERLQQLVLGNQHARLVFKALTVKAPDKYRHSLELVRFRERHKDELHLRWHKVFVIEARYGNRAGTHTAVRFRNYPLPWIPTALSWRFKLDPQDVGLKENWQGVTYKQALQWGALRTDYSWERPGASPTTDELKAQLKNYDGIGWYSTHVRPPKEWKGREVQLHFEAVNDSCWVYVNGQPVGEHVAKGVEDRNTPFTIRIDPHVNWDTSNQQVTVRVENKSGTGGIRRRVWMVSAEKSKDGPR